MQVFTCSFYFVNWCVVLGLLFEECDKNNKGIFIQNTCDKSNIITFDIIGICDLFIYIQLMRECVIQNKMLEKLKIEIMNASHFTQSLTSFHFNLSAIWIATDIKFRTLQKQETDTQNHISYNFFLFAFFWCCVFLAKKNRTKRATVK